ncbi:chemotaxis protein CheB [Luteimonas marina]|uniref:Chemotaxis protein CheB n=1 Tax=Luteimonas marina TaxID=488485 RepID=A0A5C5U729_9GAMM|nr:chemotaxis protein CheB [Luteimonas marina]TWT21230.1 chemotaxis protein CheB [Luteimonas marina]
MAVTEGTPRVALLARAGEACERIGSALREAGADVVLVADPLQADPEQVRGAAPEAILVALDPAIEDAIERYGEVLADPGYMVIFEEAEQAAQRTGWDAARWLRHLSAKLHRHQDVLPAGAEAEEDLHPTPGPLQANAAAVDFEEAIVAFTDEAQQRAEDVPGDSGLEGLVGQAPPRQDDTPAVDAAAAVVVETGGTIEEAVVVETDTTIEEAIVVEADTTVEAAVIIEAADEPELDGPALAEADDIDFNPEPVALTLDADEGDAGLDELAFDPERFNRAGEAEQAPTGIEAFLAERIAQAPADEEDVPAPAAEAAATPEPPVAKPDFSGLSLAEDDLQPAPAAGDADRPKPAFDLDALGSGLSLADPDSYGHGPVRGAVLIEAGLGGPDAVRQLLAAIPEGFPRPILIRLPLEGGRYDRLVKQMTRATSAPVAVAEAGEPVQAGSIYFVPPELGIKAAPRGWTFDPSLPFEPAAILSADDSAVLFLSGADAALVADVTGGEWAGGLVLGQTPDDGCYDPAAAQAAIAAGAAHATPAKLATMLLDRWPTPGYRPDNDPSGMLQP